MDDGAVTYRLESGDLGTRLISTDAAFESAADTQF